MRRGNTFTPTHESNVDIRSKLPVGNYIVGFDPMQGFFLQGADSFTFPSKRYGKNIEQTKRILNTFLARPSGTGIMLTGEKGSGKSLLAKTVSMEAATLDIPTLIINQPLYGDQFNAFIQSIEQPAVILFDEFEKVYESDQQEQILTLLDGVFPSKKLFILTCNDQWRVDGHMRNRPGRIFYMIEFKGLDVQFISEYCHDNLQNKEYIEKICKISGLFTEFNFDMLKALVEEMNRYNCTPDEALEWLNATPSAFNSGIYTVHLEVGGVKVNTYATMHDRWEGNAATFKDYAFRYIPSQGKEEDESEDPQTPTLEAMGLRAPRKKSHAMFSAENLVSLDPATKTFIFVNPQGDKLTLTKETEKSFRFDSAYD